MLRLPAIMTNINIDEIWIKHARLATIYLNVYTARLTDGVLKPVLRLFHSSRAEHA